MRTLGWLFAILGWALCLGVALLALGMVARPADTHALVTTHGQRLATMNPWMHLLWGLGLLLGVGLGVLVPVISVLRSRHMLFTGERGRILIDLATLEECLRKVLAEEEGVGRARVGLTTRGAETVCTVTVWLEAASDVVARVRQMQARLQDYFRYVLPDGKPLRVEIKTRLIYQRRAVDGNAGRSAVPATSGRGESRNNEDYYGGPRYPVDAGDGDTGSMTSS